MKNVLLLISFLVVSVFAFSRETKQFSYNGIYSGRIEMYKKNPEIDYIEIDLELKDSIYLVNMEVRKPNASNSAIERFRYMGFCSMNAAGNLMLKGEHPFVEFEYVIRELPLTNTTTEDIQHNYAQVLSLTFSVKLKNEWYGEKRLSTELKCDKQNYWTEPNLFKNTRSYLPEFSVQQSVLFKNKNIRDSLYQSIDSAKGRICYSKPPPSMGKASRESYERNYEYSFMVDSIRFDTAYVNKFVKKNKSSWAYSTDTLCLYQPMKFKLDFETMYFCIDSENFLVFSEPAYTSDFVYIKQETDDIKELLITDYAKDEFGIEWVKVELDKKGHDYETGIDQDLYIPIEKHVIGWVMQKALIVY